MSPHDKVFAEMLNDKLNERRRLLVAQFAKATFEEMQKPSDGSFPSPEHTLSLLTAALNMVYLMGALEAQHE